MSIPHERFIDRHRLMLLRYLDGTAGRSGEEPDALGYIDSVLAEWQEAFSNSELTGPSPEERTLWFTLYLLEDLVENPGSNIDLYEKVMMENLIEVRELLRCRQSIAEHGYMATRPNGT
ncbi:MAG: hypothetical protein IIB77_10900 [Proteobacteria bacterium]|nr:hypothetical protein [Pseudomonadota bacterium]